MNDILSPESLHSLALLWQGLLWPLLRLLMGLCAGLLLAVVSLLTENVYGAAVLGILAFSCFWSIRELFEQEQRVRKGWFPKKEKRKEQ